LPIKVHEITRPIMAYCDKNRRCDILLWEEQKYCEHSPLLFPFSQHTRCNMS